MDKNWDHLKYEKEIYEKWEKAGVFKPEINPKGEPFTITLPPPNCNGELHLGNALYVIEDILIRYKRMKGFAALWVPGTDHAGIQTQAVFEKILLKEQGKTRFDLGRKEFHKQVFEFALSKKTTIGNQLRAMGFSLDWSREKFTLDLKISKTVLETFVKMYKEELVYRGSRLVNWCWKCRTTLSDVETEDKEVEGKLYILDYGLIKIATTRPETIFADVAIAVNPEDKKYIDLVGKKAVVPIIGREIPIIADAAVELEFGTGALKVTPSHDLTDYEIGERHKLPLISVVNFDGKIEGNVPEELMGLRINKAREKTVELLQAQGQLIEEKEFKHSVKVCERCKTTIEPLISRQWFISMKPLAEKAVKAVENGEVKFTPDRWYNQFYHWMNNLRDWPVSRQIWWGHQLPIYYCVDCQNVEGKKITELIKLDSPIADTSKLEKPIVSVDKPDKCPECSGSNIIQDPDTFDTWFSSGQWPFTTLMTNENDDFNNFYPTSVLDTGWEIFFLWVTRMIMFGLYVTSEVPFKDVLVHGMLRDEKGTKMSKSKGNGVDPVEMIGKYGADATRMGLVASRDITADWSVGKVQLEVKIKSYRNFANKIWNIARFVEATNSKSQITNEDDKWIVEELNKLQKSVEGHMEKFRLGQAAEEIYEFVWHKFADVYIEKVKDRKEEASPVLRFVLEECLKLLHPFMPFVTETVWEKLGKVGFLASTRRLHE